MTHPFQRTPVSPTGRHILTVLRYTCFNKLTKFDGGFFLCRIATRMDASDEEFISEDEAQEGPGAIRKLREKLKKAVEEKQEYLEGWQRARADFANYKREEAGLHADKEDRIKAQFLEDLLPALDALELSLKHEDSPTLKMVEKQFLKALKQAGVERFGEKGEEFDPHRHEALAKQSEDHVVISVERSGYKIGKNIIRPAQVII